MHVSLTLAVLTFLSLSGAPPAASTEKSEKGTRWVSTDSVSLREAAGLKARKLHDLLLGDVVELLGEQSALKTKERVRCKELTLPWLRVRTAGGREGWVFAGALAAEKVEPRPQNWRAVVSFMNNPENASEDSAWFDEDIRQACLAGKNHFAFATPKEPCVVLGDEKKPRGEVDTSAALQAAKTDNGRWMLIEFKGNEKTVRILPYDISTRDQAVAFCKGE